MKKIWNKWSYTKRGAFLGSLVWLVAILSLLFSVIFYKLGIYPLEMFFGNISVFILGIPLRIILDYLSISTNITLAVFVSLISVIVTLFLYPLVGALIGFVVGEIKEYIIKKKT